MRGAPGLVAALWIGSTLVGGSAGAQPAEDPEAAARQHFQMATSLYEAGDYALALTEFQAAYDAKPHPTVLRNIAATQERMRNYPAAAHTLERYLAEATSAALRAERAAVETHLVGLRGLIGRVEVDLPEPGFTIEIDGRPVGTSPLPEPVEVSLGPRVVSATRAGWEVTSELVQVQPGAVVRAELNPVARMARLSIDSAARHAMISVDGAPPLAAPWENAVMPGRHEVRVTAPGRRPARLRVDLEPGSERSMVVQLEAGGPQGMISVEIDPAQGNRVTVDGLPLEPGRDAARTVEQGLHRVVAEGPDRASYQKNVRVRANRLTRVRVRLDEDRFWVSPLWGTIAAGGTALALGSVVWNGLNASYAARQYRDPSTPTAELAGLYDDRRSYARAADVALLTTVIMGAGAALLYYWSLQKPESTGQVTIEAIE